MAIEFANPTGHTVILTGPDRQTVYINKFEHRVLSDYYRRYVPKYLRIVRVLPQLEAQAVKQQNSPILPKPRTEPKQEAKPVQLPKQLPKQAPLPVKAKIAKPTKLNKNATIITYHHPKIEQQQIHKRMAGRTTLGDIAATQCLHELLQNSKFSISNDVGIGILSYNRLDCITRLLNSIRAHTDLSKTTVFVSDESTNQAVKQYLRSQNDIVFLDNKERIGVAGNTNRLLRCLERFKYKILLNDDVEILANGWESFYVNAMERTGIHHFCMRQPGVYGAKYTEGEAEDKNGIKVWKITERPQGAVVSFDHQAFKAVGYFDEQFGLYGMEHVDWSNRVALSGIQPPGYYDVFGSERIFRVHSEPSATENRGQLYAETKKLFESKKNDRSRIYVNPTEKSRVPEVTFVVPFRGLDRCSAIGVVLQNIKAQKFPYIEIIMAEQDDATKVRLPSFDSVKYVLAYSPNAPFNKSLAFNTGVSRATTAKLILHDADMLVADDYTQKVYDLLGEHDALHIGKSVLYLDDASTTAIANDGKFTSGRAERSVGYFEGGSLACSFNAYLEVGGFEEAFVGYGMEDCEFFSRLAAVHSFYNIRSESLIHLKHGRSSGWGEHHDRNKEIGKKLMAQPVADRCATLSQTLLSKYKLQFRID